MDLYKIFSQIYPIENLGSLLAFLAVILCTCIQISPIKINPWDIALGWIGNRFNSGINTKITQIDQRVDSIKKELSEHIEGANMKNLKEQRRYIINFVNEGLNGIRHSRESFEDVIRACDNYENYIKENNIQNGVINSSIASIRQKYNERLLDATFPKYDTPRS